MCASQSGSYTPVKDGSECILNFPRNWIHYLKKLFRFACNLYRCSISLRIWKASLTLTPQYPPILPYTVAHEWQVWAPTGTYWIVCLGSDGADGVRVPDDQIGIGPYGDPTLTRIQVQDFGSVGAGDGHEHVLVHLTCSLKHKCVSLCCSSK